MDMRALGRQGLTVFALGYGTMGTAVGYGPSDDTKSIAAIRRAHELGVTMFDTHCSVARSRPSATRSCSPRSSA